MTSHVATMMAGSRFGKLAHPDHYYPTIDDAVTRALIRYYRHILPSVIWENACGDGTMCRTIIEELPATTLLATDIHHYGYGMGGIDFRRVRSVPFNRKWGVITNPPFKHAEEFVTHAFDLGSSFTALFLKSQFWNAAKRVKLYEKHPPKACHPLTWRVDFTGQGSPTMDCQWVVWGDDVPFSNEPFVRPER